MEKTGADGEARDAVTSRARFREVFAVGEFRALWLAQVLSVTGDQLARVALTLLVYSQTRSSLLAAVTFVASVVPTFVGGLWLSGLADRLPRREVMIVCDLISAVLVVAMALPGVPLGILIGLLFMVTMISAPFMSARAAVYPDVLTGDRYVLGTAVTLTTLQFAQAVGFAAGGAAVAFAGVRTSLMIDAGTFICSALIIRVWVRARPAAESGRPRETAPRSGLSAGIRLVFGDRRLLIPMLLGWLSAFYNLPEGIAAPLGQSLGGGDIAVGLILAAGAFGTSVGAVVFSRFVAPPLRLRWMSPLAVMGCAVLILFVFGPGLAGALMILAISGLLGCYQLAANAQFVSATPPGERSQAFGIAQGGMSLTQGIMMILAGALAERYPPAAVIAAGGLAGTVAALAVTSGRSLGTRPRSAA